MITTALEWIGAIVALLLSLGVLLAGIAYLFGTIADWFDRRVRRDVDARLRKIGIDMLRQEHWFLDPIVTAMWVCCAEALTQGNYPSAQHIRDHDYPRVYKELMEKKRNG